jgi:chaperonin GroEL
MNRSAFIDKEIVNAKVLDGITKLADTVAQTLGPSGRTILIEQDIGKVLITKDGVTVGDHFESSDPIENVVAIAAREACQRTAKQAGDGTTTSIVLAGALVKAGQKFLLDNPHYSPQRLARDLTREFETVLKPSILSSALSLRGLSAEEARQSVLYVATVSANHDNELAAAVAEGVDYVGEDGMVIAEEGAGLQTTVEKRAGYPIMAGLNDLGGAASAAFVNRNAYSDCVLEGAYVAAYDGEVNDPDVLLPLLQRVASEVGSDGHPHRHPIVVFAHGFSTTVLKFMARNFKGDAIHCVPFVTPRNGQQSGKQAFLYDLSAYVGGTVFDPQANFLQQAVPSQLGFAEKIKISQHDTVILAEPEVENVEQRIAELKDQMESASEFDCDRIRYRIGQLTGGVATIYAGGATSGVAKERHARVVDAISAVRSAMLMGVVPGGGALLAHMAVQYSSLDPKDPRSVFAKALRTPFVQILINAGHVMSDEEAQRTLDNLGPTEDQSKFIVFDALNDRFVDWYEAGILDPAKVTLSALENALSVAQLLMTLGGVMVGVVSDGERSALAMQEAMAKSLQSEGM